jgi:hypothetical protein
MLSSIDAPPKMASHDRGVRTSCWAALWAGFTQPSAVALALVAVTFIATAACMIIFVTPARLAGPMGIYLPRAADDAEGFATRDALRGAHEVKQPNAPPRIYVPGNSIIAQAFGNDEALKRNLKTRMGHEWDVMFLTTPIQGALDEATLLEYATRQRPGIVVLSISTDRLNSDVAHLLKYYRYGRLGFRSDLADRQVTEILKADPRRRTGFFLFDNRFFYLRNTDIMTLRLLTGQVAERKIDIYLLPQTDTSRQRLRQEILENIRINHKPGQVTVDLLASTAEYLRARGNRIIFFNVPVSEEVLGNPADRQLYETHNREAEQLAGQLGGHYCGVTADQTPPPSAYHDYYHIGDAVWQERLRRRLAECVAEVQRS